MCICLLDLDHCSVPDTDAVNIMQSSLFDDSLDEGMLDLMDATKTVAREDEVSGRHAHNLII